jgi:hypothetical protein
MAFERFRNRRSAGDENGAAKAKSTLKLPKGEAALKYYHEVVSPQVETYHELCGEVRAAIAEGTADAPPERILAALFKPADSMLQAYTQDDRNLLTVDCMNYGIDPLTGEPDRDKQHSIVTLLKQGYTEPQILGAVGLAAHTRFPAILMRDDQFRQAIEAAQKPI